MGPEGLEPIQVRNLPSENYFDGPARIRNVFVARNGFKCYGSFKLNWVLVFEPSGTRSVFVPRIDLR